MIKKRSVNIHGHQTSISMEQEFWGALKMVAERDNLSIKKLIAKIDDQRDPMGYNFSSAIRIFLFKELTKTSL